MAKKTLFEAEGADKYHVYPFYIQHKAECDSREFYGEELNAFSDVIFYENQLYTGFRGDIVGDLDVLIGGKKKVCLRHPFPRRCLPDWVEQDGIDFLRCSAKGILLIVYGTMFNALIKAKAPSKLNMILASSHGIPRYGMRRLLHRLSKKYKLPVYLFTDNDTWGYFEFSVMKRGLIGPDYRCSHTAVKDTRFLGLHVHDLKNMLSPEDWKRCRIKWKPYWGKRLEALRKYPCFKTAAWKREFNNFERQRGKFDALAALGCLGPDQLIEHLRKKIDCGDWLT